MPDTVLLDYGDGPEEMRTDLTTAITSLADPTLPVTITGGPARPGERIDLEVTIAERRYNHVAWWIDGRDLDQGGRTLVGIDEDGVGHAFNRWIAPEAPGTYTVWVVVTEWFDSYADPPDPSHLPMSQPAWAELALEVTP
ncbi:MAG: hypothetical protein R3F59_19100 [Myxococcota bacterium]